jgi:hypothetical protein
MDTLNLTERAPPMLLLTDQRPKPKLPNTLRFPASVPIGFALPEGGVVTQSFNLTIEVGVRWHPEWPEPRFTANAYRFFHHGDALCWAGDALLESFQSLLPREAEIIALWHGKTFAEVGKDRSEEIMAFAGVSAPTKREGYAAFVLPEQLGRGRLH